MRQGHHDPYNLDRKPPLFSAISWQRGCQFDVPSHMQPLLCPILLPSLFPVWSFLYVLTLNYYQGCILLSHRSPGLHYLFIVALIWVLKDTHNLGMWVEESGCYHECLVTVQRKTSSCARLNKEGHESCRGQRSPRQCSNSPRKARETTENTETTLPRLSRLSGEPNLGFTSRCEGFYQ